MKATQLDSILRDYEHTEEQEAIMRDTITKKKDVRMYNIIWEWYSEICVHTHTHK